ncbi:MAG: hypothetical protein GY873_28570 [Bosea sp.]|uniref:MotE family protein n=1 Tax=Bosea sp. (in: a-proteobacteria) TaxID=1871050 RepID=UPI0023A32BD4|nr:hypothetical protein [Bosea sp. (in: a-proteobacteria)]MCP4738152.1 hypothetical protein [Bosea sp. (in: a-proteobacteria)]
MAFAQFSVQSCLALVLAIAPVAAVGQATRTSPPAASTPTAAAASTQDSEAFCASIRVPAAEARFAWQANTLKSLETKLADTLAKLEEKKIELKQLVDQREAETKLADGRMVEIFARMRPEAAALQLAAMDQGVAAALLGKLAPRNASAVLNEMEVARAAQLAEAMNGARPRPQNKPSSMEARTR